MKKFGLFIIAILISVSVFAKDSDSKTFLVIFKSKELKSLNTSLKSIEAQFSSTFKTRSYSGNSELALIIEIPSCDFDECFLGQFLVDLKKGKEIQLQEIAFRLVDMTESQNTLKNFITAFEEIQKKSPKQDRITSKP